VARLNHDRDTKRRDGRDFVFPLAAGMRVFAGSIVGLLPGGDFLAPASTFPEGSEMGRFACLAAETVDNRDGVDGEASVKVERTVVGLDFDGSINPGLIGTTVFMADDCTVTSSPGYGVGSLQAGLLVDIRDGQAWVDLQG